MPYGSCGVVGLAGAREEEEGVEEVQARLQKEQRRNKKVAGIKKGASDNF